MPRGFKPVGKVLTLFELLGRRRFVLNEALFRPRGSIVGWKKNYGFRGRLWRSGEACDQAGGTSLFHLNILLASSTSGTIYVRFVTRATNLRRRRNEVCGWDELTSARFQPSRENWSSRKFKWISDRYREDSKAKGPTLIVGKTTSMPAFREYLPPSQPMHDLHFKVFLQPKQLVHPLFLWTMFDNVPLLCCLTDKQTHLRLFEQHTGHSKLLQSPRIPSRMLVYRGRFPGRGITAFQTAPGAAMAYFAVK